ncbi:unnamed protein product [Symbiodinium sp. CCMP2592]|nr:unnamed protein product [Symbiodinium sp. CCMP2592]
MTEPDAASRPVPEEADDQGLDEEEDPWRDYQPRGGEAPAEPPPGFSPSARQRRATDLAAFEEFLQRRRGQQPNRRRTEDDDDDDGDQQGGRSNAGPPPTWDGSSEAFRDYEIRAKLWLATTKVKPAARGPLLLKNLSSTPFDDLKHLARDSSWMQSATNGEELLKQMSAKELYGEDEREEMINTLAKVTYTLRRQRNEGHKAFFARWELQIRKLNEHQVNLPAEYLGFLLINALQLSQSDIKLLMNYNQGKLTPKVVKEWTRVNEADLAWRSGEGGTVTKKTNAVLHLNEEHEDDADQDGAEDLEILLSAMDQLESTEGGQEETNDVFDEDEVKEVLATMVRDYGKGGGKRNFKAVNDAKKAKGLARGYGVHRDPQGRFGQRSDHDAVRAGNSYKVSIELLKKRTRCKKCHRLGHWHRECPEKDKPGGPKEAHYLEGEESEEALFLHYMDYLDEIGGPTASSSGASQDRFRSPGGQSSGEFCNRAAQGTKHHLKNEVHMFKSVNGTSRTSQATLVLDPDQGMKLQFGRQMSVARLTQWSISKLTFTSNLLMKLTGSPSKKTRREPEYNPPEFGWRRVVLRLMVLMAETVQRMMMQFVGITQPQEQLRMRLVETIRAMDENEIRTAKEILESAGRARQHDPEQEEWSVVEPMDTEEVTEPRKRRVPETEEECPNYPALPRAPQATINCYCGKPVETIRTKKQGPNVHRLFLRCPLWRDPMVRCPFFQWLPDNEQDMWTSGTPSMLRSPASTRKSPTSPAQDRVREDLRRGRKYPPAPVPSNTPSPSGSEESSWTKTSGASSATLACVHRNTTFQGSNGWQKITKCRDCGQVLKRESTTAAHVAYRGLEAVQENPPRPSSATTRSPKGPPPPVPVCMQEPPESPTTPASSSGQSRRPAAPETNSEEEEYEEFKRFQAMRNNYKKRHP